MALKRENYTNEDVSILSNGVKIEGKITSDGNVRIDGKVVGDVIINGNLTLGEGSEVKGEVKAKSLIVSGRVEGTISADEKLTLEARSYVKGDIVTKVLVIEEGAKFDGKSSMSGNYTPPSTVSNEAKKQQSV